MKMIKASLVNIESANRASSVQKHGFLKSAFKVYWSVFVSVYIVAVASFPQCKRYEKCIKKFMYEIYVLLFRVMVEK